MTTRSRVFLLAVLAVFLISLIPVMAKADGSLREKIVTASSDAAKSTALAAVQCEEDSDCPTAKCRDAEPKCVDGKCLYPRCGPTAADNTGNILVAYEIKPFQGRIVTEERLKAAKANFTVARQKLEAAENRAEASQKEFSRLKSQYRECKENDTRCEQLQEKMQERAKDFLLNTADRIITLLEKAKAKIAQSEDLTEADAQQMIDELNERIAALEAAKNTINNSTDKGEIRDAAKLIKSEWKTTKTELLLAIEKLKNAKIGNIIERSERLEARLDAVLEKMEGQGYNTSGIELLLTIFNQRIAEAKEKHNMSKVLFAQARNASHGTKGALVRQAQQYHKEAEQAIKEAHKTLIQIVRQIKARGGENALEEETEQEERGKECEADSDCAAGKVCRNDKCKKAKAAGGNETEDDDEEDDEDDDSEDGNETEDDDE